MQVKNITFYLVRPLVLMSVLTYKTRTLFQPDLPWISYRAVEFVSTLRLTDEAAFEWGSGRSTLWLAKRCRSLTSIENHDDWHKRVVAWLKDRNLAHVTCLYFPLEDSQLHMPPEAPDQPAYVTVIDTVSDLSLGLVVVDGFALRLACIQRALAKIRRGGYLLVDNTDWLPIEKWNVPADWPIVHQSRNYVTQTTIWQKP